eukprot:337387-Rhodomonas_salina.2
MVPVRVYSNGEGRRNILSNGGNGEIGHEEDGEGDDPQDEPNELQNIQNMLGEGLIMQVRLVCVCYLFCRGCVLGGLVVVGCFRGAMGGCFQSGLGAVVVFRWQVPCSGRHSAACLPDLLRAALPRGGCVRAAAGARADPSACAHACC